MTVKNAPFDAQSFQVARHQNEPSFNRSQVDLVSSALMWATDEVGAAIAHEMNEPLTALLLYLHEIKQQTELANDGAEITGVGAMLDTAIQETRRACEIMDRLGYSGDRPVDIDSAIARGRNTVDSWRHTTGLRNDNNCHPSPVSVRSPLTAREREVMALIAGGASNKEGSHRLGISTRTFEVHRARVMDKIGARNAADLVRIALSEAR